MLRAIKGDKKIETLFEKGFLLKEKNILLKGYCFGEEESFFGVSVSKRLFKSAVDRNRIKRQLRSVVRKSPAVAEIKKGFSFFIIYNTPKVLEFDEIKEKVSLLIKKLVHY
ncbi:MAG: ribonuclease P protein component [Flavobacteriaceae bacterium]|nr:ribonuclease P protein component [Flavobacteriaceae bacterium]|tara:strand:- start:327 stop:659 length:333 start_codon:yes stop_codon:yes gene_type:complete